MDLHVFALTGGIGSGKSTVAEYWRSLGLPVVDADLLARQVVAPGTPGLTALVEQFGSDVLSEDGELNRRRLGAIVFNDPRARIALEAILHPQVRQAAKQEFTRLEQEGFRLACYEVPLLFETEQQDCYRPVVVVTVRPETQVARATTRDTLSEEDVRARMAAQMPLDEKAARADFVIDNDGPVAQTLTSARHTLEQIRRQLHRRA